MKCSEARKHTAGLALGDLDVEIRREVESHLGECAACRAVADRERSTVKEFETAGPVETSTERREKAVGAMKAAHLELMERAMLKPHSSRRWWMVGVAAAVLIAGVATFVVMNGASDVLRVEKMAGEARVFPLKGDPRPLQPGDVVRGGDIIASTGLTALQGPGGSRIVLNAGANIRFDMKNGIPELLLNDGSLTCEVRKVPHTLLDTSNNRLEVGINGQFEAQIVKVAGFEGGGRKGSLYQHCEEARQNLGITVMVPDELKDREVLFGAGDADAFIKAMAMQGIAITPEAKGVYRASTLTVVKSTLKVRIDRGSAKLESAGGMESKRLGPGQAMTVNQ